MSIYHDTAELIQIVDELNDAITPFQEEENYEYVLNFSLTSNGYYHFIEFGNYCLWHSEDDPREFNEEENDYESLKPFIIAEYKKMASQFKAIQHHLK